MRTPQGSDPVAERARVSADETALVRAADGSSWTYGHLDEAVERTAGKLATLDVERGDHVGLLAETGVPAVRTIYGALRLGAVPVPLNTRLTADELGPQLDTADVEVLVCERGTGALGVAAAKEAPREPPTTIATLDGDDTDADEAVRLGAQSADGFETTVPDPDDVRLLLFTSGTTGRPKAVELTAENLRSSAVASALRLGIDPDDHWFDPLAVYHMGGFAPIYRSICYGTTAILQREFDAAATLAAIDRTDSTCLSVVPTMLQRMLDAADEADGASANGTGAGSANGAGTGPAADPLADLRFVLSGGAATPPALVERCADLDVALCPTYGITETCSQVATALPAEARDHEGTVGRPLYPTTVTILGDDGVDEGPGEPLPAGESGEIVVDGPTVSPGYYGDETATAESRSDLGYHTGDLGRRDDAGRLWVLGRADDAISTGGELVHPAEVVEALEAHPTIDAAAVVGLDDPEWGERVAALLVPTDAEVSPGDLRDTGADRLAGYKRPKTVALADELPRTASGTVDRDAVRERLRADGIEF
ncbi:o-succinylbenzoate-CoA ligase [Salinarchaeum sp. Harcht-Bsk1]|uniref:class I adenylate-forming enzyme family protein n=1 Tax=Salinarchaeum sp. Harcht-Bsk1 TaxID=1333523 RepID=UPI00034247A6|nr:class I adenylate-forming enzyme family protein [Salinarchaeum sp. Harcht-Bsk1]AGN00911.1 o-succinylbenzoate-CoA ligase [Salinarchaeum sp. Harcht-Bsk1]